MVLETFSDKFVEIRKVFGAGKAEVANLVQSG